MSTQETGLQSVAAVLSEQAKKIRDLEAEAEHLLHEQQDTAGYKQKLLQKTDIMSNLPQVVQDHMADLDPGQAREIEATLEGFAQRAAQAKSVDSIFFMRQLLYPEDYTPGQDNELERFIRDLAQ